MNKKLSVEQNVEFGKQGLIVLLSSLQNFVLFSGANEQGMESLQVQC